MPAYTIGFRSEPLYTIVDFMFFCDNHMLMCDEIYIYLFHH